LINKDQGIAILIVIKLSKYLYNLDLCTQFSYSIEVQSMETMNFFEKQNKEGKMNKKLLAVFV
jgi:hypothetical protein